MIQRIQTVYLILSALALGGLFLVSTPWVSTAADRLAWFEPVLVGLTVLAMIVEVGAIFLYRTRQRQRSVVLGAQILVLFILLVLIVGPYVAGDPLIQSDGPWTVDKVITVVIPIAAYALLVLARRAIQKDIELVRSMDRLR